MDCLLAPQPEVASAQRTQKEHTLSGIKQKQVGARSSVGCAERNRTLLNRSLVHWRTHEYEVTVTYVCLPPQMIHETNRPVPCFKRASAMAAWPREIPPSFGGTRRCVKTSKPADSSWARVAQTRIEF